MPSLTLPKTAVELIIDSSDPVINFRIRAFMKRDVEWMFEAQQPFQVFNQFRYDSFHVLWYHIEKYYLHARAFITHSKQYSTGTVAKALDRLADFQRWIPYHLNDTEALANNAINAAKYFRDVLPVPQNNSYSSSVAKQELIYNTAVEIRRQLQELKQQTLISEERAITSRT